MAITKMSDDQRRQMIAEAAYFRAERRGFSGGDSVGDWIEAEAEVDERLRQAEAAHLLECLEEGVASATKKLASMKRKASTLAASARAELQRDVDRLGELRDALSVKVKELRVEGSRAGEVAVHQAERAWGELTAVMRRLGTSARH